MAKANLDQMLHLCAQTIPPEIATEELLNTQRRSLHDVIRDLVRQVTSPKHPRQGAGQSQPLSLVEVACKALRIYSSCRYVIVPSISLVN